MSCQVKCKVIFEISVVDLGGVQVVYFYLIHRVTGQNHNFEFQTPPSGGFFDFRKF